MEGVSSSVVSSVVSTETFVIAMQQETDQVLREVMEAVNRAPDGAWINDSEEKVRDLMAEYRRRVFEKALQMKSDAAGGAFSPDRLGDGQAAQEEGDREPQHPDQQWAH